MNLRVLSLGAGVQSTTLALMIEKGEIPMVDCAIFSDVGAEPKLVYKHLDWLEKQLSYPIHRVQWRNLKEDILSASKGEYKAFTAPFFSKNIDSGKKSMLRRQCTGDYKLKPIHQKVRELLGYEKGQRYNKNDHVTMIMGISYDEIFRMKMNIHKYITNNYPLVDKRMRRYDCLNWLEKNNYPKPPRSACTFCPYHSNAEWREIKKNKEEWQEVLDMDKKIRDQEKFKNSQSGAVVDKLYLHRDCIPMDEVDLRTDEERGQMSFLDECDGICGV